jgi:hypothetical protein
MVDRNLGVTAGYWAIGKVVNVKDDPTQSGMVRVRWLLGALSQNAIGDDDLPWSKVMFSPTNANIGAMGGPHVGLKVGTLVVGAPIGGDGQDVLVIGSLGRAGSGDADGQPVFDSDIPWAAKTQTNGGQKQPRYGDVNGIVAKESIVKYGEQTGGGKAAKSAQLGDSIGTTDMIGPKQLLGKLQSNESGAVPPAPQGLQTIKQSLKAVPATSETPGMSGVVNTQNLLNGVSSFLKGGGNISSLGQFSQILGKIGGGGIASASPAQVTAAVGIEKMSKPPRRPRKSASGYWNDYVKFVDNSRRPNMRFTAVRQNQVRMSRDAMDDFFAACERELDCSPPTEWVPAAPVPKKKVKKKTR